MSAPIVQSQALSPEEAEARQEHAGELDAAIKRGIRLGREALWRVAQALHEFDEENAWTALGHDSLGEWLADPEVSMTRSTYHRLLGSYRELVVNRKLTIERVTSLDVSKVDIVLPAIRSGRVTVEQALGDVAAMGARDLRETYIKRPDAGSTPNHQPPDEDYTPPPVNDGTDTPKWAVDAEVKSVESVDGTDLSDAERDEVVRQGGSVILSRGKEAEPVIEAAVAGEDGGYVIEGTARDVEPEPEPVADVAYELAQVLTRVWDEVAPPHKKRMTGDLRGQIERVLTLAREAGVIPS